MNDDFKKFVEVFIDIYGEISPDEVDLLVQRRVDEEIYDNWIRFLQDKFKEFDDFDKYDEWFEKIDLNNIDKYDIMKYRLPEEKIIVIVSNEKNLMYKIEKIFLQGINETRNQSLGKDQLNAIYYCDSTQVGFSIYTKVFENKQAVKSIRTIYKDVKTQLDGVLKEYNDLVGKDGLHIDYGVNIAIEESPASERLIPDSVFEKSIVVDDLYYTNKQAVSTEDRIRIFSILKETEETAL